jgi:hypothetical protein
MRRIPPRRGDVVGIVLGVLFVMLLIALYAVNGPLGLRASTNYGFGPEWSCTSLGRGEPLCVKKEP